MLKFLCLRECYAPSPARENARPTAALTALRSGFGFGRAAVRVVERGQLSPQTVNGAAQNAQFTATIRFQID